MAAAAGKIALKLMVDETCNRVVCAECDSDFVDVLFNFLTMPMGAIIRLLGKETKMGCMDTLYQSVEDLDERYFGNKACKNMLLQPRSSSELKYEDDLAVNVAETISCCLYGCYSCRCISYYSDCLCSCGRIMVSKLNRQVSSRISSAVFVQGKMDFVVRDNLQVIPFSATISSLSTMKKLRIGDGNGSVEERDVKIGSEEVLRLLKYSLHSETALTDAFLHIPTEGIEPKSTTAGKMSDPGRSEEGNRKDEAKRMFAKLVMIKSTKQVLYLEAGGDVVNQILSFLAFPLGAVLKLVKGSAGSPLLGCLANIYEAACDFSTEGDLFISEESKTELLSPRLGCFLGCDDQLLGILEEDPSPCYVEGSTYSIAPTGWERKTINPKLPGAVTEKGGRFVKIRTKYMITDDLSVKPLLTSTVLRVVSKFNVRVDELEEQDITIGEEEAARILRASITSETVLTDVFFRPEKRKRFLSGSLGDF